MQIKDSFKHFTECWNEFIGVKCIFAGFLSENLAKIRKKRSVDKFLRFLRTKKIILYLQLEIIYKSTMGNFLMRLSVAVVVLLSLSGCMESEVDRRLGAVYQLTEMNPSAALDSLDKMDRAALSEAQRHYYDFMRIKASDKMYVRHTSDSLVLSVIDYYSGHGGDTLYAEALYYGGRVYSDMGDYPMSLRYFQSALDRMPPDFEKPRLRGHVLSQTGRLLNTLYLYEQAVPYMEEVIAIDSITGDSVNWMYDNQLLGVILMNSKKFGIAKKHFLKAKELGKVAKPESVIEQDMYLAAIEYYDGDADKASRMIGEVISNVPEDYYDITRAYGARMYLKSGDYDLAYRCAKWLINSAVGSYQMVGYETLLNPKLSGFMSMDSVLYYVADFNRLSGLKMNSHETQQAILQNSMYNYSVHERQRIAAEESRDKMWNVVVGVVVLSLLLCIVVIYLKNRNNQQLIKLHETLELVSVLKERVTKDNIHNVSYVADEDSGLPEVLTSDVESLRKRLRDELLSLQKGNTTSENISLDIFNSKVYADIREYLEQGKPIPEKSDIWDDLRSVVQNASGDFMEHLHLLAGGRLNNQDVDMAMLIKCGFTPSQVSILLARSKGTITYRRDVLSKKIFNQKMGTKELDNLIRLL